MVDHIRNEACLKSGTWTGHSLNQSGHHEPYVVEGCVKSDVLFLCKQTKVARKQEKVFQFTRRACGDMQELAEFRLGSPSTSLGDIRGDRECSSPHLVSNAVSLVFRKGRRGTVDSNNKRVALLPNLELFEILHRVTLQKKLGVDLQAIANNCESVRGFTC